MRIADIGSTLDDPMITQRLSTISKKAVKNSCSDEGCDPSDGSVRIRGQTLGGGARKLRGTGHQAFQPRRGYWQREVIHTKRPTCLSSCSQDLGGRKLGRSRGLLSC